MTRLCDWQVRDGLARMAAGEVLGYSYGMGAWGPGTFENDHALDWWGDLLEGEPGLVLDALQKVTNAEADAFLDADDCCEALAAAELLAAAAGRGRDRVPKDAGDWLDLHRVTLGASEQALARVAVARIEARSELQELWDEGGRDEQWHASLAELQTRLSG